MSARTWRWMLLSLVAGALVIVFRHDLGRLLMAGYGWVSDRDRVGQWVTGFGAWAPLVFMALQVLQVIVAPVPGEATGFIGGYLFGTVAGFLYSSLALTLGSWINFSIGRLLGRRYVRRWIPESKMAWFDRLLKGQGVVVVFILFLFPGFPKDYLCLFLGITDIPRRAFLLVAAVGRMPGTFMLSLQGEFLFHRNYGVLALAVLVTALVGFLAIRYREALFRWMERRNGKTERGR